MKLLLILVLALCGCATLDPAYYTDPNSQGYAEQVFGGLCDKCGREFSFSSHQWSNCKEVTCPYDGSHQTLSHARGRYLYAADQRQAQAVGWFFQQQRIQIQKSAEEQQKIIKRHWPQLGGRLGSGHGRE